LTDFLAQVFLIFSLKTGGENRILAMIETIKIKYILEKNIFSIWGLLGIKIRSQEIPFDLFLRKKGKYFGIKTGSKGIENRSQEIPNNPF
jgi:hypothetical protein